jgi:hypothetical protein
MLLLRHISAIRYYYDIIADATPYAAAADAFHTPPLFLSLSQCRRHYAPLMPIRQRHAD